MKDLLQRDKPHVICTDDKGVFCTTLSREYAIAGQYIGVTRAELWDGALASLDYCFCEAAEKQRLREKFLAMKP